MLAVLHLEPKTPTNSIADIRTLKSENGSFFVMNSVYISRDKKDDFVARIHAALQIALTRDINAVRRCA